MMKISQLLFLQISISEKLFSEPRHYGHARKMYTQLHEIAVGNMKKTLFNFENIKTTTTKES
jgi:hypothetical protein